MNVKFINFYTNDLVAEKIMVVLPNEKDLVVINGLSYEITPNKYFCLDTKEGDFITIFIRKL